MLSFAIVRVHFHLVVAHGQVQGAEELGASEGVEDVFDAGKWVRVLLCDYVHFLVVDTKSHLTVFFLDENCWACKRRR